MHRFDAQISWPHRWGGKERRRGSCAPGPLACSPLTYADLFGEEVGEGKGAVAYSFAHHGNPHQQWRRVGERHWQTAVEDRREVLDWHRRGREVGGVGETE